MTNRYFDEWLSKFRPSISTYDYYVDFEKVYRNVDEVKIELNLLNSLIGSKDIKTDFVNLLKRYPEILKAIPILLAKRENEIYCQDENGGKQMKDVWTGALTKPSEKTEGKHPTQKPEYLLERIVLASTEEGQVIIDPFCGSGTTGVEAVRLGRKFIGIDVSEEYLQISKRRLEKVANDK